jgi:hypothetical protein
MIKFFRKIRQKLLSDNKFSKYLIYAVGEIVLVVIGILIALQINNWNEKRKSREAVKIAIEGLIADLKKDTLQLRIDLGYIDNDFNRINDFRSRLSHPLATIDSVRHIARYEYSPFFDPSNNLNRNTITSLLSTGRIDDFEQDLKNKILTYNTEQLKSLRTMDQNISIYLNNQAKYSDLVSVQSELPGMEDYVVKGPLLDQYWQNRDDKELLDAMLTVITSKSLMYAIVGDYKKSLKENTEDMIIYLQSYLDEY